MSHIFLIDVERRDWAKRTGGNGGSDGDSPDVTRRYLMIVENEEIRKILRREFSQAPHAVYPHESGKDFMFYCIAGPSCRRPKRMIEALFYKLRKNNLDETKLNALEVLTA